MTLSPSLWDTDRPSLQVRFEEWLRSPDGQFVYGWIRERSVALRQRGWRHYGIASLWEAARYARDVNVGPDKHGLKLDNSYRSRLARRLMDDEPLLRSFFEVRRLSA